MTLINSLNKANNTIIRTYKSNKTGNITHIIDSSNFIKSKKAIFCDKFEKPNKIVIVSQNKAKEIYKKAPDGSTIMIIGEKIKTFPYILFNRVCENVLK